MPVLFIASVYTHYPGAWLSQEISGAILVVHMCTKDAGWSAVGVVLPRVGHGGSEQFRDQVHNGFATV